MSDLKALRAEHARLSDLLVDARIRETRAILSRLKEDVVLYGITEKDIRTALGFDKDSKKPLPPKYRDPKTGATWSGKGRKPQWLIGRRMDAYLIEESTAQPWWPEKKK